MKFMTFAFSLVFSLLGAGAYAAPPQSNANAQEQINSQIGIASAMATIRSQEAAADFIKRPDVGTTAFGPLSSESRQKFVDSLVFTEKGLASFRYAELEAELTPTQIYKLLSLFGAQHAAFALDNARVETALDRKIRDTVTISSDYPDYMCYPPATCVRNMFTICIGSNCGMQEP
ncbi:MAG: hypothetical protein R3270_02655 [Gammaproteobacteria bacterium]|nr:hypothetical protein [Gammaproteobacteria bacterium]